MADKTVKHFVVVRFFERKVAGYVHDIFDVNFVAERVLLAKKNLLSSLENQTNKNFEIIFLVNDRYLSEEKYKFIFTELQDGITVPLKFTKSAMLRRLVKDAYNDYDFVIQTRIDYDDFAYKDAVADTQAKIDECNSILAYGYNKGYVYFNDEMYPFYDLYLRKDTDRQGGHSAVFHSVILKSEFAKKIPYIGAYSLDHTNVKSKLKEFLEKNGVEFAENMYRYNASDNALIFFRHDFTESNKGKPYTENEPPGRVKGKKKLTGNDITKKQLEDDFAFHYDLKSIK